MTRREWLALKRRVKISHGDEVLLRAFWAVFVLVVVVQFIGLGVMAFTR